MITQKKRVNDVFPKWFTSGGTTEDSFTGVISNLIYPYYNSTDRPAFQIPYNTSYFPTITYGNKAEWLASLDVMFSSRFGYKKLAAWVRDFDFHNDPTKTITSEQRNNTVIIAKMINLRYADKWNHIAEALEIEYNPLENYDRNTDTSFQHSNAGDDYDETVYGKDHAGTAADRKDTKTIQGGWTDADTRATETSGKYDKSTVTKDSIKGFNDTSAFNAAGSPSEYSEVDETYDYDKYGTGGKLKETNSGDLKHDYHGKTQSTDYNEQYKKEGIETVLKHINNGSYGWDKDHTHGNIGVTTSQQMLESELEVRKNILYDIILKDISDFICLSIY